MATKAREIAKETDKLLDARQRSRFAQLNTIERLLVVRMLSEIKAEVDETEDGRVKSRKGYASIAKAVDLVFDQVEEQRFGAMASDMVSDMRGILKFNADYFESLGLQRKSAFKLIRAAVDARMRQRLGISSDNTAKGGGYLDRLFTTASARDEVKKLVEKQVRAGVPMRKLEKALRVKVAGTKGTAGVLEKHLGGFVLDTYNLADSITNAEFAKRLDLKYFIYSGGLIETSREFCRKRNNKVYTTEEAERDWPKDKTLPRTKAEAEAGGAPAEYVPLEDRGRWNCRHRILYIPKEEAVRLRPDLAGK